MPGPGWGDDGGGEDRTGSLPRPTPAVITLRADLGNRRNSQLHLREESDFPSGAWLREWRGALGGRSDAATLGGYHEPAPLEEAGGLGRPRRVWKCQGVQLVGVAVGCGGDWAALGGTVWQARLSRRLGLTRGLGPLRRHRWEAASSSRPRPPGSSLSFPRSDPTAT